MVFEVQRVEKLFPLTRASCAVLRSDIFQDISADVTVSQSFRVGFLLQ